MTDSAIEARCLLGVRKHTHAVGTQKKKKKNSTKKENQEAKIPVSLSRLKCFKVSEESSSFNFEAEIVS